jgi:hypothetical protein
MSVFLLVDRRPVHARCQHWITLRGADVRGGVPQPWQSAARQLRRRAKIAHPTRGTDHESPFDVELARQLKQLILLETLIAYAYDALDLDDASMRAALARFAREHENSARALHHWLALSGGDDDESDEARTVLAGVTQGLTPAMAMWLNEEETARAYEQVLERPIANRGLAHTLERGLDGARVRWEWLTLRVHGTLRCRQ